MKEMIRTNSQYVKGKIGYMFTSSSRQTHCAERQGKPSISSQPKNLINFTTSAEKQITKQITQKCELWSMTLLISAFKIELPASSSRWIFYAKQIPRNKVSYTLMDCLWPKCYIWCKKTIIRCDGELCRIRLLGHSTGLKRYLIPTASTQRNLSPLKHNWNIETQFLSVFDSTRNVRKERWHAQLRTSTAYLQLSQASLFPQNICQYPFWIGKLYSRVTMRHRGMMKREQELDLQTPHEQLSI